MAKFVFYKGFWRRLGLLLLIGHLNVQVSALTATELACQKSWWQRGVVGVAKDTLWPVAAFIREQENELSALTGYEVVFDEHLKSINGRQHLSFMQTKVAQIKQALAADDFKERRVRNIPGKKMVLSRYVLERDNMVVDAGAEKNTLYVSLGENPLSLLVNVRDLALITTCFELALELSQLSGKAIVLDAKSLSPKEFLARLEDLSPFFSKLKSDEYQAISKIMLTASSRSKVLDYQTVSLNVVNSEKTLHSFIDNAFPMLASFKELDAALSELKLSYGYDARVEGVEPDVFMHAYPTFKDYLTSPAIKDRSFKKLVFSDRDSHDVIDGVIHLSMLDLASVSDFLSEDAEPLMQDIARFKALKDAIRRILYYGFFEKFPPVPSAQEPRSLDALKVFADALSAPPIARKMRRVHLRSISIVSDSDHAYHAAEKALTLNLHKTEGLEAFIQSLPDR